MNFPDTDPAKYSRHPVVEVICQVRFPRLLEIDHELPVRFQKIILGRFPRFETQGEVEVNVSVSGEPQKFAKQPVVYAFSTADGHYKLTLSSEFIALSSQQYGGWSEFRPLVVEGLSALLGVYRPSIVSRIGLRYVNFIRPDAIGEMSTPWGQLLRPGLLGLLAEREVDESDVLETFAHSRVRLGRGAVVIRTGLSGIEESASRVPFVIDNDFYLDEQLEAEQSNVLDIIDNFHVEAGRVFRWCLSEKLHQAMGPDPTVNASP